eukprot:4236277-Amphidinium_carterae.1
MLQRRHTNAKRPANAHASCRPQSPQLWVGFDQLQHLKQPYQPCQPFPLLRPLIITSKVSLFLRAQSAFHGRRRHCGSAKTTTA